mgnify:CR=1 FL=1
MDIPHSGTTSQCTTGGITDAEDTGYKTYTVNLAGLVSLKPSDPTLVGYQYFLNIVKTADTSVRPRARFKLDSLIETTESTMGITNWSCTGAEEEHKTFTATLQAVGDDYTNTQKPL